MKPVPNNELHPGGARRRNASIDDLAALVRANFREARAAALSAGETLHEAQPLISWDAWETWLAETCGLTPGSAQRLMDHALDRSDHVPEQLRALAPLQMRRVVCGWCKWLRARQGLEPKHVSGPESAGWVVHGACSECTAAVDRLLDEFRAARPMAPANPDSDAETTIPPAQGDRPAPVPHPRGWGRACFTLRYAFYHLDQVRDGIHGLLVLDEVGVIDGLRDLVRETSDSLEGVTRLAAELILIASGEDYDDSEFGGEATP